MTDAFSCCQHHQQRFPPSAMLVMAAAAAATAREDASDARPALSHSSFLAALPLGGAVQQLHLVLELDAASGALVFSSQLGQQRTAHLRSFVVGTGQVRGSCR